MYWRLLLAKMYTLIYCRFAGNGVFKRLGEKWFDEYWMNYGKIQIVKPDGKEKKITLLKEYLAYRGKDPKFANPMARKPARKNKRGQK